MYPVCTREPPNKRMQLTALQFKGTLVSAQAEQSPQLMRGPLGGRRRKNVNRAWVLHHLREAHEELGRAIADIESDTEYDLGEFIVALPC